MKEEINKKREAIGGDNGKEMRKRKFCHGKEGIKRNGGK